MSHSIFYKLSPQKKGDGIKSSGRMVIDVMIGFPVLSETTLFKTTVAGLLITNKLTF